jgi:hypothetical protein
VRQRLFVLITPMRPVKFEDDGYPVIVNEIPATDILVGRHDASQWVPFVAAQLG